MSGNGIRALAWVAVHDGSGDGRLVVDTGGGRREIDLELDPDDRRAGARDRRHGSGHLRPRSRSALDSSEPITEEFHGTAYKGDAAGVGNPHLVLFVEDPATARVTQHGPRLEHDERFPNRTNVEFIALTPGSADALAMRVWERGVGETSLRHRRVRVRGGRAPPGPGGGAGHRARARRRPHGRSGQPGPSGSVGRSSTCSTPPSTLARLNATGRQRRRLTATEVDLGVVRQRALLVGTGFGLRGRGGRAGVSRSSPRSPTPRARSPSSSSCSAATGPTRPPTSARARSRSSRRSATRSTSTSSSSTTSSPRPSSATWRSSSRSTWSTAPR